MWSFVLPILDGIIELRWYPSQLKYQMPIHYEAIKDVKNKNKIAFF